MCGICGIINFDNSKVQDKHILEMMKAMKHRGPDDEGTFIEGSNGLGFVRLSILDLSPAGHQPMFSKDERFVIVFNGEVYNYLEIKEELKSKYEFRSNTDTEVVLYSYLEWGKDSLHKFNGMFAFVIFDRLKNEIFGARDRFGIKPFYYHLNENQFIFASDIPPILKALNKKPTPNDEVICNYLFLNRTNYSENTFFNEIKKLQHGHFFYIKDRNFEIFRWYDVSKELKGKGFKEPKEYYECLKNSIQLQLRSDVPVGICLSGGLDSSSIASILIKENMLDDLHSYSAIYNRGDTGDEQEFIDEFKGTSIKMHFTNPSHKSLLQDLNDYITALSEPVPGTSIFAEFKVMELAKKHSTVLLNGQGVDEVLGGYDYFYGAYLFLLIKKLRLKSFITELISLSKFNNLKIHLKYFIFFLLPIKLKYILLSLKAFTIKSNFKKIYNKETKKLLKELYQFNSLQEFFIKHLEYKFEHHLLWADKTGMFFSLETRFPFLDHNLVENTLKLSEEKILFKGLTKVILRDALKNILPDKIRNRTNKVGFETPENEWFRTTDFREFISDIINSETFKNRRYFNVKKVKKMYKEHIEYKANYGNDIWKIIHLELWVRKYID